MNERTPFVRPDCKDCGATQGMGWWTGRMKHPGSAGPRCQPCYNAYAMANYYRRTGKTPRSERTAREPAPRRPETYTPAPPVACAACGEMFKRSNASMTCPACATLRRRSSEQRRRERERRGDTSIHWRPLGERDGWRCHICCKPVPRVGGNAEHMNGATVDHLLPIADGGEHEWHNVALAHRSCNLARGTAGSVQLRLVG